MLISGNFFLSWSLISSDEKTLKEKIKTADPVVRAILRSLLIRLNDINMKSEDFWRSLNVMTSLSTENDD